MEQLKTGTTTVGIKCKDCIVLAADKRATAGHFIADKKVQKVQPVNDYIAVTTAGSVSDLQLLVKYLRAELKLRQMRTGRTSTVKEAANLLSGMIYQNIRSFSVIPGVTHFLLAGFDKDNSLYDLYPDGSLTDIDDFVSSGSGSVMAYGVLETLYEKDMTEADGIKLAFKCLNAAIQRDSASGNGVDVFIINKDGVTKRITKILDVKVE
ncbi:MAG: proteasome subunit beta [Nanoarchaeota archaeon]|nr:proteasome subunit beta [Nanoarchaeota archaeon]